MELIDEYNHNIPNVMYFPRNLPSKEVESLYEQCLQGCNCELECTQDSNCCCLRRSGTLYKYNNTHDTHNYTIHENIIPGPTYECNDYCSCHEQICGNKLVQFGPRKNLKVEFCNDEKGLGLFTSKEIKKGNFVCEYAGEVISENQAFERFKRYNTGSSMNYIFCIKEYFGEKVVKTFIDPTHYGNIGRYINHSCEPNCKLFVIRINDTMPILGIFAKKDITENSEITYDYAEGGLNCSEQNKYVKRCSCNTEKCRKYLPYDISLQ